jgi:uridine kinase
VTVATWEGRRIFRASVGLLLLEAARRLWPGAVVRLGPRRNEAQLVLCPAADPVALAREMQALVDAGTPLTEEVVTIGEARARLLAQGWTDAAALLAICRVHVVDLAVCGSTVALGGTPLVHDGRLLDGFALHPHEGGMLLDFGRTIRPHAAVLTSALPAIDPTRLRARATQAQMSRELDAWLGSSGVQGVGAFNAACVGGQVEEIVRITEGFHEKHVGRIADAIVARTGNRVVAIAGPSASGKTTFIQRLSVQLEVDGRRPVHLSLDDYYVDRARTPRDGSGAYDFESIEAIDRPLLEDHVRRLLCGERVQTARYDFTTGLCHPTGGAELTLTAKDVLLLEGLHALSPDLLPALFRDEPTFRIFVHPATALPIDRLNAVLPEDLRLLRRIVRDRHFRGYSAKETIQRWPSVRRGEEAHVFSCLPEADVVFDSSLVYEIAALRVYADRYLLEVDPSDAAYATATRLRQLIDLFVPLYPDHVPPTSILREFIGGSSFDVGS